MPTSKSIILGVLVLITIWNLPTAVYSTGIPYTPDPSKDYLVKLYDYMPFKDQRGDEIWSSNINANYSPNRNWDTDFSDNPDDAISYKCLSYGASSVNDWFNLQYGIPMREYKSFIHGEGENGTNPRFLEAIYHEREGNNLYYSYTPWYSWFVGANRCPISNERIPYRLDGFADILMAPASDWVDHADPKLSNPKEFNYTYVDERYNVGNFREIPIDLFQNAEDENRIMENLEKYGSLLSYTEKLGSSINVHSVAIVGHGEDGEGIYFIAHDNYGTGGSGDYSEYKKLYIEDIDQAFAFIPKGDWYTFHHNYRRSGFTLLRGQTASAQDARNYSYLLSKGSADNYTSRPSIADLNNNGKMEIVVVAAASTSDRGTVSIAEFIGTDTRKSFLSRWRKTFTTESYWPPTVRDIDGGTGYKEVVMIFDTVM